MNTTYQIAVFLHVLGMGGLFAALAVEWIMDGQLRKSRSAEEVRAAVGLMRTAMMTGGPASIVILFTGGYMTHAVWDWGQAWISHGLATMVLAFALGGVFGSRKIKAIGLAAAAETGPLSARLKALLAEPLPPAMLRIRTFLLFAIVFLMTVRPGPLGTHVALGAFIVAGIAAAMMRRR